GDARTGVGERDDPQPRGAGGSVDAGVRRDGAQRHGPPGAVRPRDHAGRRRVDARRLLAPPVRADGGVQLGAGRRRAARAGRSRPRCAAAARRGEAGGARGRRRALQGRPRARAGARRAPHRPSLVQDGCIGASLPRKEDDPLLRGIAPFADDVAGPGALHAHVVRSPVAHGRISSLDVAAARRAPGVRLVVTAADLPRAQRPIPMRMFPNPSLDPFLQPPLARDAVRYSGEPIAVVVADSRCAAEDAGELVELDVEPLEPALRPEEGRVAATFAIEWGDVDAALPLEGRGVVAHYDGDVVTVRGAAKIPHINRRILARLLEWPEERVRLVELYVGGGF